MTDNRVAFTYIEAGDYLITKNVADRL